MTLLVALRTNRQACENCHIPDWYPTIREPWKHGFAAIETEALV